MEQPSENRIPAQIAATGSPLLQLLRDIENSFGIFGGKGSYRLACGAKRSAGVAAWGGCREALSRWQSNFVLIPWVAARHHACPK